MKSIPPTLVVFLVCSFFISQNISGQHNSTAMPRTTRAIIFGVSSYNDTLIPPLPQAKSDAEQFAAFLRSRSGGLIPADLISIKTDQEATIAHLLSMSSWVQEESRPGDQAIIYISCHAGLLINESNPSPFIYFADSPKIPVGAGTLPLSRLFFSIQEISAKYSISFQLYLNLKISKNDDTEIWRQWMYAFQRSFPEAFFSISAGSEKNKSKYDAPSYLNYLLNGYLGEADYDDDGVIVPWEIIKNFKKKGNKVPQGEIFLMAFSSEEIEISFTKKDFFPKNNNHISFPPMVGHETSQLEDSLLSLENEKTRQWYNDFIITMKIGQLMSPKGRCASEFYDSLSTVPSLSPLHRRWQRKLGAALLDETQQALNAYLKTDSRELFRRWKHANHYDIYPGYMERAIELMGNHSFMSNIMQTKLHYFKGLKSRLDGERQNNKQEFKKALAAQELALSFEPEAAFVLNEIGVLHVLMDSLEADKYFIKALEYSPTWSIPHLNLSVYYRVRGMPQKAMEYAVECARLNPENVLAVNNLGVLHFDMGDYMQAEKFFRQAVAINIKYEVSYYNLSCTKAAQGHNEAALLWLEKAVGAGYMNWEKIENDPDLAALRELEGYKVLKKKFIKE